MDYNGYGVVEDLLQIVVDIVGEPSEDEEGNEEDNE